jgi:hypothetical protein
VHGSDGGLFPLQELILCVSLPLFGNKRERERCHGGKAPKLETYSDKVYVNNTPGAK